MFQLFNRNKPDPITPQHTAEERAARQAAVLKLAEEHLRPKIQREDFGFPFSLGYRYREYVESTLRRQDEDDPFRVVFNVDRADAFTLNFGAPHLTESARISLPRAFNHEAALLIPAALGVSVHRMLAARLANHDRREMAKLREDLIGYRQVFRGFAAEDRFEVVASILKTEYSREAREAIAAFRASLAH
ncbi:MAG: hypothetical protein RR101_13235 [Burkholderiaceae bacterium]